MKNLSGLLLAVALAPGAGGATLPLDPDTAARLAVAASHRTDSAAARHTAARERVLAAAARRLPTVDLETSLARRSSVPETVIPDPESGQAGLVLFPNIQDLYRAGLVVTQPLWSGGSIAGAREAARHEEALVAADRARVEIDLESQARVAYWAAVAADAARAAVAAEVLRAERLSADARALREVGLAVRADELGAEARLAAARRREIETGAAAADRLAELRSLLGVPPDAAVELRDRGAVLPGPPPELDELLAEAHAARPELAGLAARRAATRSRARVAAAVRRPQLSLSGRWDVARPNDRYLPPEDAWNSSWSVGVSAGWRLFDGNRASAEAAAIEAEALALAADLAELERAVALEVESARRAVVTAVAADRAAAAALAAAAAREADCRERYAAGVATVAEVLDAQEELARAELAQASARAGSWVADARLRRAVGR